MKAVFVPEDVQHAVVHLNLDLPIGEVPEINVLLKKTVLLQGKRFRPLLCFLIGKSLNIPLEILKPYARAAELVHAATLAHDDVIDESEMRRNRPTLNRRSSNARAVLAGDLLLARVMSELSALGHLQLIEDLSWTVESLVQGEWLQLEARFWAQVTRQHLEKVAQKKTASLMAWCALMPARLAGLQASLQKTCFHFGESLGMAFQMIDDILDYDLNSGKPFAQDLKEGLVNFVTFELLEANPQLLKPIEQCFGKSLTLWPWKQLELDAAQERVRAAAQRKLSVAEELLGELSQAVLHFEPQSKKALEWILVYLKERVA